MIVSLKAIIVTDRDRFPLDETSISSLRIFKAVVDADGYSAAARQMKLSVSSVSKTVSTLERAMGVALLFRTTRKVSVTEAGRAFYARCIAILEEVDAASFSDTDGMRGHLRVSAAPSVASEILGPGLRTFMDAHPHLKVDLFVTSALPDIVKDRVDVALVLREWPEVKMANRLVARLDRILCASPGYLAARGAPSDPLDLQQHVCLVSLIAGAPDPWVLSYAGGRKSVPIDAALSCDNGDMLRLACTEGIGVANLYAFHAIRHLQSGELVRVLPGCEQEPVGLYAVLPHREIVRSPATAFMDHLERLVADRGEVWSLPK
jgi:DNA-binding transcriptional LysR family regulator